MIPILYIDGGYHDSVLMVRMGGEDDDGEGGEDEDGDVHRSHGDASPEAAAQTCHPLQIRLHLAK